MSKHTHLNMSRLVWERVVQDAGMHFAPDGRLVVAVPKDLTLDADPNRNPNNPPVTRGWRHFAPELQNAVKSFHEWRIDWFTGVIYNRERINSWMRNFLGSEFQSRASGLMNCHTLHTSDFDPGLMVREGKDYSVFIFSGSSRWLCDRAFWAEVARLSESGERFNVTRIDVTMDQTGSKILPVRFPMDVHAHILAETFAHGFKVVEGITSADGDFLRLGGRVAGAIQAGDWGVVSSETLYLGSRESAFFARIYDEKGPLRWEWECKQLLAVWVAAELVKRLGRGECLGEVLRDIWCGLAERYFPRECSWWAPLGVAVAVDPEPEPATLLASAVVASVRQYGSMYIGIIDSGNRGIYDHICRRAVAGLSRNGRWKHSRRLRQLDAVDSGFWQEVGLSLFGAGAEAAQSTRPTNS